MITALVLTPSFPLPLQLSFGAAPAFAAFALGLRLPLDTLFLTLFVCAGIARLARFNVTTASIPHDSSGKARYFEGLPIPSSLALVGGMALCLLAGRVEPGGAAFAASAASKLPFTGALADKLPGTGVPLGTFSLDLRPLVQQVAVALPTSVGKHLQNLDGVVEVHKLALLWGAWAMAMVSKTLRVPKP